MKILIADDEKETVSIIHDFLVRKGHEVDVADDGKMALGFLERTVYDLMIFDHNMPELTGLELIEYAHNELRTPAKLVMITGYAEMEEILARALGADAYLRKPFMLADIEAVIARFSTTEERSMNDG